MQNILERLKNKEILISDGAMGTMLMERGLKPGDCPEKFNIEQPKVLEEIARLYLDAGANIVQTNTFGASPLKLADYSLADKADIINSNAVKAVKSALNNKAYTSASCGPTGKLLEPYGDTDPQKIYNSYKIQMKALISSGADLICIETMIDLAEASLAIRAAKAISPAIPVMATMTFDCTPKGIFTVMGTTVEQAAKGLERAGADIVGSNCGNGIENMVSIAKEFKKFSDLPIIIQSNAGLPEIKDGQVAYGESPQFMAEKAKELINANVSIIGGCCGTTPEHISAFRKAVLESGHRTL
ncbi:homocysteine S-methyltransferase family protein [Elusimicrobiota bacterium]